MINRPFEGRSASCVASPAAAGALACGNGALAVGPSVPCPGDLLAEMDLLAEASDPFMPVTGEGPGTQQLIWWPEGDGY
jgi:hypothetical protein